jgi:hypothetical protein
MTYLPKSISSVHPATATVPLLRRVAVGGGRSLSHK